MPSNRPASPRKPGPKPLGLGPRLTGSDVEPPPWFSRENLRGWPTSVTLHVALLFLLACIYFAPKLPDAPTIDSRLAGSEMGVEGGLELAGGLNTPLEMTASEKPIEAERTVSLLPPIELTTEGVKSLVEAGTSKPSGGGGMDNNNPGAGDGSGFGLARFGDGGENIRGVAVKVGDPQFTLLWDSEVDLDLHVIEPGGKEIYWEDPKGQRGGELDVDNTKGFGPENIYWLHEDEATGKRVKGAGPPGEYKWFVHYWGGFGGVAKRTGWKVRIKHNGQVIVVTGRLRTLNERSQTYHLKVEPKSVAETARVPGSR